MTRYVALLRAVNVAGRKVAMTDLRRLFEELGYADVRTYIQTGNVLFTSGHEPDRLTRDIEQRVATGLGVPGTVVLRTADELRAVTGANPFLGRDGVDARALYVTFLAAEPDPERAAALDRPAGETADFVLSGREVYLHYPAGAGRTRLNNAYLERRLGVAGTSRNWRVVGKLSELANGSDADG